MSGTSECPTCGGAGWVLYAVPFGHPLFGQMHECPDCDTAARQRLARLRQLSGIVGELQKCTFENFERVRGAAEACKAAQAFAEEPKGWLVLTGGYGSGKTHLAAAVNNYLEARLKPVLFAVVPDLLDHLRATFAPGSPVEYDELFEAVRTVPILILDDLAAENPTAWAMEKLYQILDYRARLNLPTLITTNLKVEQFEGRLRTRLTNRLIAKVVVNKASDYRQEKPKDESGP